MVFLSASKSFSSDQREKECRNDLQMASSSSPCAACKFLRRKCMAGCIFAPYFPPEDPQKFANVHRVFGASNVTKLLSEVPPHQREDAVSSLAYEAEARVKDPVYGCVGAISVLQRQVQRLQDQLEAANAELLRYEMAAAAGVPAVLRQHAHRSRGGGRGSFAFHGGDGGSGAGLPPAPNYGGATLPWAAATNRNQSSDGGESSTSM